MRNPLNRLLLPAHPESIVGISMARTPEITRRLKRVLARIDNSPLTRRAVTLFVLFACISITTLAGLRIVHAADSNLPPAKTITPADVPPGSRVLHFPANRSMGKVMIRDASFHHQVEGYVFSRGEYDWDYLAPAIGDVAIPPGKLVKLDIDEDAARDLTPLKELKPGDIDWLHCAKFTDQNLPCIAHLTGVYMLDMRLYAPLDQKRIGPPAVTERGIKSLAGLTGLEYLYIPSDLDNRGLAQIARVKSLKGLYLRADNTITDKGLDVLAGLPNLEELSLHGNMLTANAPAHLAGCQRLHFIEISGKNVGDDWMKDLKNIPSLRTLNIGRQQISDAGIVYIGQIKTLETLALYHNELITNNGLRALQPLHNLKYLSLSWCRNITDAGVANLRPIKSLETLDINTVSNPDTTDKSIEYVSELPNLKALTLNGSGNAPITDAGVQYLSRLQNLEELRIAGVGITDKGMAIISRLPKLSKLALTTAVPQVTNAGIAELKNAKNLKEFTIGESKTTIDCLNALNSLTGLTRITILNFRADNSNAAPLDISGLVNLDSLDLMGPRDVDLACLANLKNLKWVQFAGENGALTDAGIKQLSGLTEIWRLNINGPGVTDASIEYLAGMHNLRNLYVTGRITDAGLDRLSQFDSLEFVMISSTHQISGAAQERFRSQHPRMNPQIYYDPGLFKQRAPKKAEPAGGHPKPGAIAPDFTVKLIDGKEFKLSDHRGKVVILHFWASWSQQCVRDAASTTNEMNRLKKKFGDRLVWIDLSLDDYDKNVTEHVKQFSISAPEARIGQHSKIATDYAVRTVPDDFMIGPDGKILLNRESPQANTADVIEKALK